MNWIASSRVVSNGIDGPASIAVDNGVIVEVQHGLRDDAELIDGCILPGYIDTHCHGGAGAAFADPDPDRVRAAIEVHRRHGTTTQFASTVTESLDDLEAQITRLRPLVEAGELAGIHLEGPFLAESRKGAHDPSLLRAPDSASIDRLLDAGAGAVRMVTLAPELPGGLDAVAHLRARGVIAAFGHSDADAVITHQAIDAGCTVATHLFNAMNPIHHRKPGPIPALLVDERITVELILDGVHLNPDAARLALSAAGFERVMLITDAMAATGQPDGEYELGPLQVRVTDGRANILNSDGSLGAIAGSTLTMGSAVHYLVSVIGVPLVDAALMASEVPARVHGLSQVGTIEPGKRADLCVTSTDGTLARVMWHGEWLE